MRFLSDFNVEESATLSPSSGSHARCRRTKSHPKKPPSDPPQKAPTSPEVTTRSTSSSTDMSVDEAESPPSNSGLKLPRHNSMESLGSAMSLQSLMERKFESCCDIPAAMSICHCDDCLLEITDTWADLILWQNKATTDDLGAIESSNKKYLLSRSKSAGEMRYFGSNSQSDASNQPPSEQEVTKRKKSIRQMFFINDGPKMTRKVRKIIGDVSENASLHNACTFAPILHRFESS